MSVYGFKNNKCKEEILEEVAVNSTEPTNGEKVWLQKGKNLFDKNAVSHNAWIDAPSGSVVTSESSTIVSRLISVNPNTQYIFSNIKNISGNSSAWVTICGYSKDKEFNEIIFDASTGGHVFTTGENDYYIRMAIGSNVLDTVQLEKGSTATDYEAYVDKRIYCKNDDGVYEEFVNIDEIIRLLI